VNSEESKSGNLPQQGQEELLQKQLEMVKEWEARTGQKSSTADLILKELKRPMTQSDYLWIAGYGMTVSEALDDEELLQQLPEWFQDLPKGESPGVWN
jgi:hypothetical protein